MKKSKFYFTLIFLFLVGASMAQVPFTAGNIVVYRVGTGTTTLVQDFKAVPVFLDEYTPAGVLVQTIAMPTTASGGNHILTGVGFDDISLSWGGMINLSSNGQYLVIAGYDAPLGGPSGTSTINPIPKVIGLVNYNASINTTTAISSVFNTTSELRSAITTNGTDIWIVGSDHYLQYTTTGSTTSIPITGTPSDPTGYGLAISNGQLYVSVVGGAPSIGSVGSGTPTTAGQTITGLPGIPDGTYASQFAFADLNPSVPGNDVLYVSEYNGIEKFSLVSGSWQSNGVVDASSNGYRGLTAKVTGTSVTLFATRDGSNDFNFGGGELVKVTDASGYNGAFSGTPTVIATNPTDKASFRGVALVPQAPALKVAIKTFLQGAYSIGLSRHKDVTATWAGVLNSNALSQPYNTTAFGSYAGTESVSAGFFTSTGATTDILDWVLVELRNSATPTTVVARRAAFIREDGRIVDLDGTSDVSFNGVTAGNYYIVVRHRNHLSIRSSSAIALSSTATLYDFTALQAKAFQDGAISNPAMKDLGSGVFGMYAGNANSNTSIRSTGGSASLNDFLQLTNIALGGNVTSILGPPSTAAVYSSSDLNMDGVVRATGGSATLNDLLYLWNIALSGNVTSVITAHQ